MNLKNVFIIINIIKDMAKKWTSFKAYELGIIDNNGKLLRSPQTQEEKDSYDLYTKFIINLKRIIQKFTGSNISINMLASMYLLKEGYAKDEVELFIKKIDLPKVVNESEVDYEQVLNETLEEFERVK